MRYGIYTRRIRPLWYLRSFSGEPEDILIAYGQGKSAVNFMVRRWGEGRISDLFAALRQTNDIDAALMRVYGVDQHGMDSAWRVSLGLEPLPSPEELESRMQESDGGEGESAAAATPAVDTGDAEPGDGEPALPPESTAAADSGGDASADAEAAEGTGGDTDSGGAASGGCSAPADGAAPVGMAMLAVMVGPLALGGLPFLRRGGKGRRGWGG